MSAAIRHTFLRTHLTATLMLCLSVGALAELPKTGISHSASKLPQSRERASLSSPRAQNLRLDSDGELMDGQGFLLSNEEFDQLFCFGLDPNVLQEPDAARQIYPFLASRFNEVGCKVDFDAARNISGQLDEALSLVHRQLNTEIDIERTSANVEEAVDGILYNVDDIESMLSQLRRIRNGATFQSMVRAHLPFAQPQTGDTRFNPQDPQHRRVFRKLVSLEARLAQRRSQLRQRERDRDRRNNPKKKSPTEPEEDLGGEGSGDPSGAGLGAGGATLPDFGGYVAVQTPTVNGLSNSNLSLAPASCEVCQVIGSLPVSKQPAINTSFESFLKSMEGSFLSYFNGLLSTPFSARSVNSGNNVRVNRVFSRRSSRGGARTRGSRRFRQLKADRTEQRGRPLKRDTTYSPGKSKGFQSFRK